MAGSGARVFGTLNVAGALHNHGSSSDTPDRAYLRDYEHAFRNDPYIYRTILFVANSLVGSLTNYVHPDPKIQTFINEMLREMTGDFKQSLREAVVSSLWAGHAVTEMALKPKGLKIVLERTLSLHPSSTYAVLDENGFLTEGKKAGPGWGSVTSGLYQDVAGTLTAAMARAGTTMTRLPMNKTALIAHNARHGNVLGESVMTPIWSRLEWARHTYEQLLITTERYGSPQIAVVVPRSNTREDVIDPNGTRRKKSLAEDTAEKMSRLNVSNGVVLEEPVGLPGNEKVRFHNISSFNNFGESYLNIIRSMYTDMLVGLGLPPLLFLEHEGGLSAGSIAAIHSETYKQTLTGLYDQLVLPFVEQTLGRLVYWNFGDSDPGRFEFAPYDIAALNTMMTVFETATSTGYLDPEEAEDVQLVRSRLNLPLASEDTLSRRLKRNKTLMERLRQPDLDKKAIASERNTVSENIAAQASDTQKEVAKIQGQNMRSVAKVNAEAKAKMPAPKPPGKK